MDLRGPEGAGRHQHMKKFLNRRGEKNYKEGIRIALYRQYLYNTPRYNTDLKITQACYGSQIFSQKRNNRKMTMKWSFPYDCYLAHLSRRLRGELIVYQWLWLPSSIRPSIRQHFQTSSPLKLLGQLNSNFIWRFLRMGERKFVQMVLVTWPRWPPHPYMVKTF